MQDPKVQEAVRAMADYGETKIIDAHEFPMFIGWELIAVINVDLLKEELVNFPQLVVHDMTPGGAYAGQPASIGGGATLMAPVVVRVPRFIIGRPKESTILDLQDRLKDAQSAATASDERYAASAKKRDELSRQLATSVGETQHLGTRLATAAETMAQLRTENANMESALSVVRNAIGELQFKKIVEGAGE
jgi:hypothetical protein